MDTKADPKLFVFMEGGLVTCIVTDDHNLIDMPIVIVDYDADEDVEENPDRVMEIDDCMAWVRIENVERVSDDSVSLGIIRLWLKEHYR